MKINLSAVKLNHLYNYCKIKPRFLHLSWLTKAGSADKVLTVKSYLNLKQFGFKINRSADKRCRLLDCYAVSGKGKVIITEDSDSFARRGAELFLQCAVSAVNQNGRFSVALSGGSTPRPMNRLLACAPYISEIPWNDTHVFMVDERIVPFEDSASNFGTAQKDFLDSVPIPSKNLHPMPVHDAPEIGADHYEEELKSFFLNRNPVFDLILLGIGTDGHTASMFPGDRKAHASERWVLHVKGGNPDVYRISLTFNMINQGRSVAFLISGSNKAPLLKALLENPQNDYPANLVRPESGDLIWLVDQDAASKLTG